MDMIQNCCHYFSDPMLLSNESTIVCHLVHKQWTLIKIEYEFHRKITICEKSEIRFGSIIFWKNIIILSTIGTRTSSVTFTAAFTSPFAKYASFLNDLHSWIIPNKFLDFGAIATRMCVDKWTSAFVMISALVTVNSLFELFVSQRLYDLNIPFRNWRQTYFMTHVGICTVT